MDENPGPAQVATPIERKPMPFHLGLLARLRAYFLAGVLVTAPVAVTFDIPGLGLVIAIIVLILIGAVTAGYLGRVVVRLSDAILARMPVVRSIYGATKQIFETVLAHKSTAFRQVCLVEYPRRGIWSLGFVTGTAVGEIQERTSDQVVNVFLPTTPNPTSGFLLLVPTRALILLKMSV